MLLLGAIAITAALTVGFGGFGNSSTARKALTKVRVVFVFAPSGLEADLVAAKEKGFFEKHGLDVQFVIPGQPGDPQKLVASGRADIGVSHSSGVLIARAQGIPLLAIATRHQQGTNGVLALKSSGIKSLKDLEGKTISVTGVPENKVMLAQMLAKKGVDQKKVHIITAGFNGQTLLAAGKVAANGDAISWFEYILVNLAQKKPPLDSSRFNFWQFTKNGVPNYYEYVMFTSDSYAKAHPDTLKKFLAGWSEGMNWARANPKAAVDLVLKDYPTVKAQGAFPLAEWKAIIPITKGPNVSAHCNGWMARNVWVDYANFLNKSKFLSKQVNGADAFTNKYLPCAS
jgi:ABC-type nitrate/sulfonate/bicarbonate transport system substrate-binding protein